MIVGEAQILGQVKEAYTCAFEAEATSIIFNKLFTAALRTGKRVRSETAIGESATSVSSAAVALAERVFEDLQGRTVMILGAGKMSELTAQALQTSGVTSVIVSNRTYERAVELARAFKGRAVKFDEFTSHMVDADIVISSTGAPDFILRKEDMTKVMRERRHTPIFLIDIAVPRDIEPKVGDLYNVFLYDIDDLQSVVSSNLAERAKEAEIGEAIIDEEVEGFNAWISSLEVTPTITDLKVRAETIRSAETEKIFNKLPDLSEKAKNEINALTKLILAKLLHEPVVNLKKRKDEKDEYLYVESIRHLFGLKETGRGKSEGRKEKERE
jgi:glutamyl-tRNA reductase